MAFLDLLRTTDILSRRLIPVLKSEDLSSTQYNVLRILRGAPAGLACGEIAGRMITRDPDVTRLLDRLEKRGLISRSRETKDRRTVMTRITSGGLEAARAARRAGASCPSPATWPPGAEAPAGLDRSAACSPPRR